MSTDTILKLTGISKSFSGVEVLHGIDLEVNRGEIHALVGENGAGKSTLVKILSGVYPYGEYEGEVRFAGDAAHFKGIADAERAGIEIISQELELVPQLPVYENVYLGAPLLKKHLIDSHSMIQGSDAIFRRLGVSIDPSVSVEQLGVGHQQMVAIAKALRTDAALLILDEPTAALSDSEADMLFSVLRELKQNGITIIYISHRLKEVMHLSDRVTVLRDGKTIVTRETADLNEALLVQYMIGRELGEQFPVRHTSIDETVFGVKHFSAYDSRGREVVHDISFQVRKGEILGIAGLVGAGRSELVQAIFGDMNRSGEIILEGKPLHITSPLSAIQAGIGLVSEDRKKDGFVPMLSLQDNVTLANLRALSTSGIIRESECMQAAQEYRENLRIKSRDIYQPVEKLSGGNQQKVCIAKFLMTSPKVLILDEPTRGVDVGAKYEIYVLLNQLVEQGIAVIIVSSELPELLGMTDRIMVMSFGRQRAIVPTAEASQELIMQYATKEGA